LILTILGRRDFPTDAVTDYCALLGSALAQSGIHSAVERVAWDEMGWGRSLVNLWRQSGNWRIDWALVQYTALMWSRRGFPLLFPLVLCLLRLRKVRVAVVFHDREPYSGRRLVDKVRRVCQRWVMRWAYRLSSASVLNVPVEDVTWLPPNPTKASFIPVGANVPVVTARGGSAGNGHEPKTIAVFGITGDGEVGSEVPDIASSW
jgi:hypothetical protein